MGNILLVPTCIITLINTSKLNKIVSQNERTEDGTALLLPSPSAVLVRGKGRGHINIYLYGYRYFLSPFPCPAQLMEMGEAKLSHLLYSHFGTLFYFI